MGTSKEEISKWFDDGKKLGATHLIVVCDTFDWADYPVFAQGTEEFWEKYKNNDGINMQKIMEVYDLNKDKEDQLLERRAMHLPSYID